ncbi:MAG: UDP-3-O-acyl-N-acetylglucosamine deacetylase [Alphaproteobacteria bacterium]|nr:UDP-3-O-acyl-N-acetylglucosamine deacetylase [Alphaproteobacteria bacterium]
MQTAFYGPSKAAPCAPFALSQNQVIQRTLAQSVSCVGVGVHSGKSASLTLCPALEGTGYVFIRTDIASFKNKIQARYDSVVDTMMCTKIANSYGVSVSTIEHVVAALSGANITNVIIEVNGPEVPIMDGSSAAFSKMIDRAGVQTQDSYVPTLRILKPVKVTHGNASAEFVPGEGRVISVQFDGHDRLENLVDEVEFSFDLEIDDFSELLSDARTFGFYEDAEKLWAAGLAKGASLENTVVIQNEKVINEGGLRSKDELIRHKVLDAVGDLALSGVTIVGHFHGINSGHALNNQLLRVLFATPDAWTLK